jgi:hypothetical protein
MLDTNGSTWNDYDRHLGYTGLITRARNLGMLTTSLHLGRVDLWRDGDPISPKTGFSRC